MRELIFGFDCVKAALSTNRRNFYKFLVYDNRETQKNSLEALISLAKDRNIPLQYTTRSELDSLTEGRPHQNVALQVSKFEPAVLEQVPSTNGLWVVAVNLLDPQNLGSIIRSAAFFGAAGVITTFKKSADYTPIVSKASAGVMESFEPLFRLRSLSAFLENSKTIGNAKILGTGLNSPPCTANQIEAIKTELASRPIILLLGSEGSGLPADIVKFCDENVTIKRRENPDICLDSLNVSVAAGVIINRLLS